MKSLWSLTLLGIIGTTAISVSGLPEIWTYICSAITILLLLWLWIATITPVKKAAIGIELLKGEEYNNRLAPSHEPGANRIVKVFNNLMDRLSEERLRLLETNNLLELLVKASPMGVAIMDFDNRFTLVNSAFTDMTGADVNDLIGSKPGINGNAGLRSISKLNDGEEIIVKSADTEIYRISRLSFMEKGFRRPFILTEKLTDEIRKAEKDAYGKVVRTISHEVNNTIGGLQSFLETLSDMEYMEPELRELASSCIDGCGHLVDFIRGYADIVKIGQPVLQTTDYNAELCKELPFLKSLISEGIKLETDLCETSPVISIDRAMMRQTLVNIVKNSAESIAETGRSDGIIRIITRIYSHRWSLEIEDNGKGVSEKDSGLLFNPFHTTKKNGQGLGLTLSSEILRLHGFKFSLETVAPGKTIFRISGNLSHLMN